MPAAPVNAQQGSSAGGGGSPSRPVAGSQQESSRRLFYHEAAHMISKGAAQLSQRTSPYDFEIRMLFLPALVAGLLEPLNQTAESILVGQLGVSQASAGAALLGCFPTAGARR